MKKNTKIIITVAASVLLLALIGVIVWNVLRHVSKEKILSFKETYNENGIATDTDIPYTKKQLGYSYRSPETIRYHSDITNTERKAMVFLPADYDKDKEYPVLYLLHGYGGSEKTWRNKNAAVIIQNLYYFKDATEMIVVCPDCVVGVDVDPDIDFWDSIQYFDRTEDEIINNLKPYIESHYPVKTGRENTAIAGNSMGGRNALAIGFKHQDMFGYVGGFSSVSPIYQEKYGNRIPALLDELSIDELSGPFELLMICVGRSDEVCGDVTYELDDYFNERGIEHIFYDVEGGHQNTVWQNALYNFVQRVFK